MKNKSEKKNSSEVLDVNRQPVISAFESVSNSDKVAAKVSNWEMRKLAPDEYTAKLGRGRPRAIKTPEDLWNHACDYFANVDRNQMDKVDFIRGGDLAGTTVVIEVDRPYTWEGFNAYLFKAGILESIDDYKSNKNGSYDQFSGIIRAIGAIIFERNFDGAATGAFSPNLIARQLGLADKVNTEANVNTKSSMRIDYSKISTEALNEIIAISSNGISEAVEELTGGAVNLGLED